MMVAFRVVTLVALTLLFVASLASAAPFALHKRAPFALHKRAPYALHKRGQKGEIVSLKTRIFLYFYDLSYIIGPLIDNE